MSDVHDLVAEIDADVELAYRGGRRNHLTDLTCSFGAIAASFLAAVLAAVGSAPGWAVASVAALPGLCASLQRVIDFRGRAAWYFIKAAQLRDLSRSLKYETTTVPDAAKRLGEIETSLEERWSEFVKSGAAPPARP